MLPTTLATVALDCATQLGRVDESGRRIVDLERQINREITETIRYHSRRPWHLSERREMSLATVQGRVWYDSVISGEQEIPVRDILGIDRIRESGGLTFELEQVPYDLFERRHHSSAPSSPNVWTRYGDEIGIYPVPDGAYVIEISGKVKPTIPANPGDQSVWFDAAAELVVSGAAKRVCLKYLRDRERAQEFATIEAAALDTLHGEYVRKASTGRLRAHD